MKMKMKYTEQAVETLDDAGSVIANKNIEIEQLRQRVAELEKERDELKLVVSAHADFFSRTQSEMADLKESVECLSATNDFLAGKRDENIILKAAVKQLTAERDAAITNLRVEQIAHLSLTDLLEKENVQLQSALKVAQLTQSAPYPT